ncbi:hypothetical protein [Shewanella glacialipiscicola]|uniref:hypothetical protein n=1 Tax=Shewanella glacialipiscicola TaxID=614069 RepID=UPI003D7B0664
MTDFSNSMLSLAIILSSMFAIVGVMYGLLKYRDATVKLPVDREQLARIPAYGLQQQIQDLQLDLMGSMMMGLMMLHILVDALISTLRS